LVKLSPVVIRSFGSVNNGNVDRCFSPVKHVQNPGAQTTGPIAKPMFLYDGGILVRTNAIVPNDVKELNIWEIRKPEIDYKRSLSLFYNSPQRSFFSPLSKLPTSKTPFKPSATQMHFSIVIGTLALTTVLGYGVSAGPLVQRQGGYCTAPQVGTSCSPTDPTADCCTSATTMAECQGGEDTSLGVPDSGT
jgi:hypothetical protein